MAPLPFQQLTSLNLRGASLAWSDTLAMIAGLPQLEVLSVLWAEALELSSADAVPLSQLPMLRLVNLQPYSHLWRDDRGMHPVQGHGQRCFLPRGVAQHLMFLQRTLPHIEFVVDELQPFDWHMATLELV
jgi:hypothetical protein